MEIRAPRRAARSEQAVQVDGAVLRDDPVHVAARRDDAGARALSSCDDARDLAAVGGRGERDDRLAAARERRAADEVHLAADARVDAVADRVGAHLTGEVDLQRGVDRDDAGFLRMSAVSLVRSQGWNSTSGLSSTKSKPLGCPMTKLVTMRPGCTCLKRLVTAPVSTRSTSRSENISVWTPRSRLLLEAREHRVGDRADAHLEAGAVLDELGDDLADARLDLGLRAGGASKSGPSDVIVNAVTLVENGHDVLPCVRGMRSLISASSIGATSAAARAASTDVPSVQ
jgi:hypothetical protein